MKKVISIITLLVLTGIILWSEAQGILAFRERPTANFVYNKSFTDTPFAIIRRTLAFQKGSNTYLETIRHWYYRGSPSGARVSDTAWNRAIFEHDLNNMDSKQLSRYLPKFPLSAKNLLPYYSKSIEEGNTHLLGHIDKVDGGTQYFDKWIKYNLINKYNEKIFLEVFHYLGKAESVDLNHLFNKYSAALKGISSWKFSMLAYDYNESPQKNSSLLKWITTHSDSVDIVNILRLSTPLIYSNNKKISNTARKHTAELYFSKYGGGNNIKWNGHDFGTTGWLNSKKRHISSQLEYSAELLKISFDKSEDLLATDLYHFISHIHIEKAEDILDISTIEDSVFKKGAIVILARHEGKLPNYLIDEAFKGAAPRLTKFSKINQYIYGSKATAKYELLSGHKYMESGKQFPPANHNYILQNKYITAWKAFIEEYPWHPGTDDAYYQVMYYLLKTKDFPSLNIYVDKYLRAQLPDRDADAMIGKVISVASRHTIINNPSAKIVERYHQILDDLIFQDNIDISSLNYLMSTVENDELTQRLLGINGRAIRRASTEINKVAAMPFELRATESYRLSKNHWGFKAIIKSLVGVLQDHISWEPVKLGQEDPFALHLNEIVTKMAIVITRPSFGQSWRDINVGAWSIILDDSIGRLNSSHQLPANIKSKLKQLANKSRSKLIK